MIENFRVDPISGKCGKFHSYPSKISFNIFNSQFETHQFSYLYQTHFHNLLPYDPYFDHFLTNNIILLSSKDVSTHFNFFMALFLVTILISMTTSSNAYWSLSPGYRPSPKFSSTNFYKEFINLWDLNTKD